MTVIACTTPTAPFYDWDIVILSALESAGIDMPCNALLSVSILVFFVSAMVALAMIGLIAKGVYDYFRDDSLSRRVAYEPRRMTKKEADKIRAEYA